MSAIALMISSQLKSFLELTNDSPEISERDFAVIVKLEEVCYCSHMAVLGSLEKRILLINRSKRSVLSVNDACK